MRQWCCPPRLIQMASARSAAPPCMHSDFDPGSRFECRLYVPGYSKKDLHNDCPKFVLTARVERQTSASANPIEDARSAFENLFKK